MTTNLHGHRLATRSFSEIAEEKCARFRRETRVLQQQTTKFYYFQQRLMDTFTSWRKGWYHTVFSAAAAHCKPQREGTFRVLGMKGRGKKKKISEKPRFVINPSTARILPNPRLSTRPTIQEFLPTIKTKVHGLAKDMCKTQRRSNLMDLFCNEFCPNRKRN